MSDDEVALTVFSTVAALGTWIWWYGSILLRKRPRLATGRPPVILLLVTPLAVLVMLLLLLRFYASHDVRDAGQYLYMYSAMGSAWAGLAATFSPLLGFSLRGDVLRYRNRAVAIVLCGWIWAATFAFAGGNLGDGPHWGVVMLCALLATGSLVVIVVLFVKLAASDDALTIEHDRAAAFRLAGLMVSTGAILGTAVAGDWVSLPATLRDFAYRAWPAVVVLSAGLGMEKLFRSSREVPRPSPLVAGVVPALVMVVISAATVAWVGFQ